jgi:hypothetical protein
LAVGKKRIQDFYFRVSVESGEVGSESAFDWLPVAGNPNSGTRNATFQLVDLARAHWDGLLVLSNVSTWGDTKIVVQTMCDLSRAAGESRATEVRRRRRRLDSPGRTNSYEVVSQWTPAVKRFSNLGVVRTV